MMKRYTSKSGKPSGVNGYQLGKDFIKVRFSDNSVYKYTYATAGSAVVKAMSKLAVDQLGLSTYISQHQPTFEK